MNKRDLVISLRTVYLILSMNLVYIPTIFVIEYIIFQMSLLNGLFPSFPMTTCGILATWFSSKGLHLRRWLVAQPSDGLLAEVCIKFQSIITLLIPQTRLTWHSELVRNSDKSWWGHHTPSVNWLKIVYLLSMEPWAAAKEKLLVSVAVPPAPVRVPNQRPLAPSVTSVTSVTNNKDDN